MLSRQRSCFFILHSFSRLSGLCDFQVCNSRVPSADTLSIESLKSSVDFYVWVDNRRHSFLFLGYLPRTYPPYPPPPPPPSISLCIAIDKYHIIWYRRCVRVGVLSLSSGFGCGHYRTTLYSPLVGMGHASMTNQSDNQYRYLATPRLYRWLLFFWANAFRSGARCFLPSPSSVSCRSEQWNIEDQMHTDHQKKERKKNLACACWESCSGDDHLFIFFRPVSSFLVNRHHLSNRNDRSSARYRFLFK